MYFEWLLILSPKIVEVRICKKEILLGSTYRRHVNDAHCKGYLSVVRASLIHLSQEVVNVLVTCVGVGSYDKTLKAMLLEL